MTHMSQTLGSSLFSEMHHHLSGHHTQGLCLKIYITQQLMSHLSRKHGLRSPTYQTPVTLPPKTCMSLYSTEGTGSSQLHNYGRQELHLPSDRKMRRTRKSDAVYWSRSPPRLRPLTSRHTGVSRASRRPSKLPICSRLHSTCNHTQLLAASSFPSSPSSLP